MLHVKVFTFNPVRENTYLVYNDAGICIIIDPGCYHENEREEIARFIMQHALKPAQLVNTHCHLDHVFGNKFIAETYGLELYIHQEEKTVLDFAPTAGLMWNLPFDSYSGAIHFLLPGNQLVLGADRIDILFTPGHSPGSLSFYAPKEGFIISGDLLFRESVGRTDLPGGDFPTLQNSIRTQLYSLPDTIRVLSGHGAETTIGWEKAHNPYISL